MPTRAVAAILAAAALVACGEEPDGDARITADQIERLATAPEDPEAPDRSVRLEPLGAPAPQDAPCRLVQDGAVLVAASGAAALVRIGGRMRRLDAGGPVGPTGAFFETGGISVSIGRTGAGEPGGTAALAQVANRSTGALREFDAQWSCDG